jgi:hypothetical protein
MAQATPPENLPKSHSRNSGAILLTLADTTWRIAVPTISLALIGIAGDLKFGTKPWLTLFGTLVGFGFAIKLVALQLKGME